MELCLELMAAICAHFPNAEWEFFNYVIDKVDGVCLGVFFVNLKRPNSRSIIDCGILETPYLLTAFSFERQKLNINLNMVVWNLFLIAFGVKLAHPCPPGKSVEAVAFENPVDPGVRDFDIVIAGQARGLSDSQLTVALTQIKALGEL